LCPLLLAGLLAELEHIAQMLKPAFHHKYFGQRTVAAVMASGMAAVLIAALAVQFYMTFGFLQSAVDEKVAKLHDQKAAYAWISSNLPASAMIFSYDDPLLYLYTGRRAIHSPLDPLWWYREDHASILDVYRDLPAFCRSRGLEYVYVTTGDLAREAGPEDQRNALNLIRANPELERVFEAGIGTVYKVGPPRQSGSQVQAAH